MINEDNYKDHFGVLMLDYVICAHIDGMHPSSINRNDTKYQIGIIFFSNKNGGEKPSIFKNISHKKIKKFINEMM